MSIYLFPIFCFGLVITGIVALGVMQTAEEAKRLREEDHQRNHDRQDEGRRQTTYSEVKAASVTAR